MNSKDELRPVAYRFPYSGGEGMDYKGFFHGWATRDGNTYAIVESSSTGLIILVQTYDIKFLDR